MKQSRKDFIIEAHKHACSEWKERISEEFSKLFKETELEVGIWYSCNEKGSFWFVKEIQKNKDGKGYGLCMGTYKESNTICINDPRFEWKPATNKEVETALINEAKKRGFKEGVIYNSVNDSYSSIFTDFCSFIEDNQICSNGGSIFYKGKWATIIETITKEEAEKQLGKKIVNN